MTKLERRNLWASRVTEFKSSGQSVPAWCAANELRPNQLRYWLSKHEAKRANTRLPAPWLPLDLSDLEPSIPTLTIRVGRVFVEVKPGFDPALLLDVVRTLSHNAE